MTGPRVVLAEDDVLLREGLARLLGSSGYEVVGQAGDGRQLLGLARGARPEVEEFLDALQRIARGGSVVDPALVRELVSARRREDPLAALSAREREVLALMAEGRSNAGIARRLFVTEGTVEKHISSILTKLNLHEADDDHRRVLAVITFLKTR